MGKGDSCKLIAGADTLRSFNVEFTPSAESDRDRLVKLAKGYGVSISAAEMKLRTNPNSGQYVEGATDGRQSVIYPTDKNSPLAQIALVYRIQGETVYILGMRAI